MKHLDNCQLAYVKASWVFLNRLCTWALFYSTLLNILKNELINCWIERRWIRLRAKISLELWNYLYHILLRLKQYNFIDKFKNVCNNSSNLKDIVSIDYLWNNLECILINDNSIKNRIYIILQTIIKKTLYCLVKNM